MARYYCLQTCTDAEQHYREEGKFYEIGYDPKTPYLREVGPADKTVEEILVERVEQQDRVINELRQAVTKLSDDKKSSGSRGKKPSSEKES